MPMTIGLLPSQQESFDHHEELSKLSNESEVFYVPLQNDFTNHQDLSDLTKRFDEDILNKHLVVTFRDIGYSLFLDSVKSIPDQNDQTKTRVSGKMIVDGICIKFLGSFDCHHLTHPHSDGQQINGTGRVFLDEDYYRELSSNQVGVERELHDDRVIDYRTRHEIVLSQMKPSFTKSRSRTISENLLEKSSSQSITSPPSSVSNSRSRLHSPNHMPYPLRSPRTIIHTNKQHHQQSSPVNIESPSVSRSSGFHSSFISPSSSVPSSYNDNHIEASPQHHIQFLSPSGQLSSSLSSSTTKPIQIPSSSSSTTLPPASVPQLTGLFPINQSHSLPTYFLPQTNFAYLSTGTSAGGTSMFLITNSNQHPLHIITPIEPTTLQFSNAQCSAAFSPTKRQDQNENKYAQPMETNKQTEEQLPLKKRRYAGQQTSAPLPMDTGHLEDDEASNESMKK